MAKKQRKTPHGMSPGGSGGSTGSGGFTMDEKLEALRALEDERGGLTPEKVVNAVEEAGPSHPCWGAFTWDDTAAARERRLDQARHLIASCRLIIRTEKHVISSVAYVRDPSLPSRVQGYRAINKIAESRENSMAVVMREAAAAQAALERGREVAAALGLSETFDDAINGVLSLVSRLRRGGPSAGLEGGDPVH